MYRLDRHDLGIALLVPAGLALSGVAVAVWAGETREAVGFAATCLVGGTAGMCLRFGTRRPNPRTRDGVGASVALGWLAAAVLAAIPFGVAAQAPGTTATLAVFADPLNALFESMSGLTSTGLSVAPDASALPLSLQWWRSALQWIGAVGILTLATALATSPSSPEVETETDPEGIRHHLVATWGLYSAFTVAGVAALWASGMAPWEAVNHGMTSIATGGFSVTSDSFESYSRLTQAVALGLTILGSVSFGVHYAVLVGGDPGRIVRDAPHRLLAALLVAGALLTAGVSILLDPSVGAWNAVFGWVSALTTAGFSSGPLSGWSFVPLMLLIAAMLVGGVSGSTTGGLKQDRLLWLLRGVAGRASASDHRQSVRRARLQLWRVGGALVLGTLVLVVSTEAGLDKALFEAASALGTVGLSTGLTGPELSRPARIVLTGLMWAGRLEIVAVLTLMGVRARKESA